jgi:hypothetical protein
MLYDAVPRSAILSYQLTILLLPDHDSRTLARDLSGWNLPLVRMFFHMSTWIC